MVPVPPLRMHQWLLASCKSHCPPVPEGWTTASATGAHTSPFPVEFCPTLVLPIPVHKDILWVQFQVSGTLHDKKQYHLALYQSYLEASKNTPSSSHPRE
jgi:hypothetical protein